jgi:hypothetical protein
MQIPVHIEPVMKASSRLGAANPRINNQPNKEKRIIFA